MKYAGACCLFLLLALDAQGVQLPPPSDHSFLARGNAGRLRRGGRSIEILEPWQDAGRAAQSKLTPAQLQQGCANVQPANYGQALRDVVSVAPTRFVGTEGNAKAAEFVAGRLRALGFEIREQQLGVNMTLLHYGGLAGTKRGNIIAIQRGSDLSHEVVTFGAHYDSVNWDDTSGPAPGADDDGSGLAALLMVAEAVAREASQAPLRRSVVLAAFQAEEVGLKGSRAFVEHELANLGSPVATLIADQVAYPGRPQFARRAIFETVGREPGNVAIVDTLAHQALADGALDPNFDVNYDGFGSDHIPFLDAGHPAVLLIERDNLFYADNWGHTAQDTLDRTDASFGAAMGRLAARTVLALASPM